MRNYTHWHAQMQHWWLQGLVMAEDFFRGHEAYVSSVTFSYDGQLLASGSIDGIVKIWDECGNLQRTLLSPQGITWLRWRPREHALLAGSEDSIAWMWNADTGACLNKFVGHDDIVTCGDFTPDGKIICTGSDDASLRIWNPESGENIHVLQGLAFHREGLRCLAISPTSTLALTGSEDGNAHIVDITAGRVTDTLPSRSGCIECVGFAPRGTAIYTLLVTIYVLLIYMRSSPSFSGDAMSKFLANSIVLHEVFIHLLLVRCNNNLRLDSSLSTAATLAAIPSPEIADPSSFKSGRPDQLLLPLDMNYRPSSKVIPGLQLVVAMKNWISGISSVPYLEALITIRYIGILPCGQDEVTCLAWVGESYVATGCKDGIVRLWDCRSCKCVQTFTGHSDTVGCLSVSANQKYLVSASFDHTACVFDIGCFRMLSVARKLVCI
ncbi:hypothetical protein RIF29_25017 [Crotalaria pallida]|uniref:Uncharacterized protein n=1 Tax=Crotalaria pallida TaxID=3830 RepID=A0AAN9EQV3_CROPI